MDRKRDQFCPKEARATQETNKKLKCASSSSSDNERKITSVSSSVSSSKIMDRIVTQVFV